MKQPDGYVNGADFYPKDSTALTAIGFKEKCKPVYFNSQEEDLKAENFRLARDLKASESTSNQLAEYTAHLQKQIEEKNSVLEMDVVKISELESQKNALVEALINVKYALDISTEVDRKYCIKQINNTIKKAI